MHVSEMSWGRPVNHPSEIVKVGDRVEVVVLSIDEDRREISLGLKQASGDPWADVEKRFPVGSRVKGAVRNLTGYGAFVELAEGVDGLLHVSDISWTKKINHPSAVLKKGDEVEALVLSVDSERKRVALGLKQLDEDPWANNIPGRYKPGDKVKGKVTKLANFGAFVEIEADLEGLLHVSEISDDKVEKPEDVLKVDQEVELTVINVDAKDRKIGLSMKEQPEIQAAVEAEPPAATVATAAAAGVAAGGAVADTDEPRQRTLGDLLARHTEKGAEPEPPTEEAEEAPSASGEADEAAEEEAEEAPSDSGEAEEAPPAGGEADEAAGE